MNRKEFLTKLNKGLSDLPERDRREIVKFYYDRISRNIKLGKTEEEAINDLDSLSKIVRNILSEHNVTKQVDATLQFDSTQQTEQVKQEHVSEKTVVQEENQATEQYVERDIIQNKKTTNIVVRLFGLLGLLVFDILLTSWLIPVAIVLIITALIVSGVLFVTPVTVLLTTYNLQVKVSLIAGTIGLAVISTILVKVAIRIFKFIVQGILNFHYNVLSGRSGKRFRFNYGFNLRGSKYKFLLVLSVLTIIGSFAILVVNSDNLIDNYLIEPDYINEEFVEEIDLSKTWDLTIDAPSSKLEIEFYDGSEIKFVYDRFEDEELDIEVNQQTNTISYRYSCDLFSLIELNPYQQKASTNIKVYIPNDTIISDLELNVGSDINLDYDTVRVMGEVSLLSYNGDIVFSNIEAESVSIESYNGDVVLSNVIANSISIVKYNGSMTVMDTVANDLYIINFNGNVKISNVTAIVDANSSIAILNYNGDVLMTDVYLANADIETYNGDINYYNENKDYEINFVKEPKSYNGEEYIDI